MREQRVEIRQTIRGVLNKNTLAIARLSDWLNDGLLSYDEKKEEYLLPSGSPVGSDGIGGISIAQANNIISQHNADDAAHENRWVAADAGEWIPMGPILTGNAVDDTVNPMKFRKIGNIVTITGEMTPAVGTFIFAILPPGFRPHQSVRHRAVANDNNPAMDRFMSVYATGGINQHSDTENKKFCYNFSFIADQ